MSSFGQERVDQLDLIWLKATKPVWELESMVFEERLRELGFFQPGEEKAWWDIKLLSSPVLWQDFRMPRMQFSGYQSCLHLQILHSCV